jgi:hypothetical protein
MRNKPFKHLINKEIVTYVMNACMCNKHFKHLINKEIVTYVIHKCIYVGRNGFQENLFSRHKFICISRSPLGSRPSVGCLERYKPMH